jgi:hypothetical protein
MKVRLVGAGIAMAAMSATAVVLATPVASYAATCYTGCHTSTPKTAGGHPSTDPTPTATQTAQAQALAFTGANVILPAGIGGGAIIVGGTLMFAGKRRRLSSTAS